MTYNSMEEAFNDALEESAAGLGYSSDGLDGLDGFGGPEGFDFEGADGFEPFDNFDYEGDAFLGKAFKKFGGLLKRLPLKQLAPIAAKVAGGALGGPIGAQLGGMVGGMLGEEELSLEGDGFEFEASYEDEGPLQEDEAAQFGLNSLTDSLANLRHPGGGGGERQRGLRLARRSHHPYRHSRPGLGAASLAGPGPRRQPARLLFAQAPAHPPARQGDPQDPEDRGQDAHQSCPEGRQGDAGFGGQGDGDGHRQDAGLATRGGEEPRQQCREEPADRDGAPRAAAEEPDRPGGALSASAKQKERDCHDLRPAGLCRARGIRRARGL